MSLSRILGGVVLGYIAYKLYTKLYGQQKTVSLASATSLIPEEVREGIRNFAAAKKRPICCELSKLLVAQRSRVPVDVAKQPEFQEAVADYMYQEMKNNEWSFLDMFRVKTTAGALGRVKGNVCEHMRV